MYGLQMEFHIVPIMHVLEREILTPITPIMLPGVLASALLRVANVRIIFLNAPVTSVD